MKNPIKTAIQSIIQWATRDKNSDLFLSTLAHMTDRTNQETSKICEYAAILDRLLKDNCDNALRSSSSRSDIDKAWDSIKDGGDPTVYTIACNIEKYRFATEDLADVVGSLRARVSKLEKDSILSSSASNSSDESAIDVCGILHSIHTIQCSECRRGDRALLDVWDEIPSATDGTIMLCAECILRTHETLNNPEISVKLIIPESAVRWAKDQSK